MKKEVEIEVILFENGTVEAFSSNYQSDGYTQGTIDFVATIDGRRKLYDPMEALHSAKLVKRISSQEDMFPTYQITPGFKKLFKPTAMVFTEAQVESETQKVNAAVEVAGLNNKEGWDILSSKKLSNLDLYKSSISDLVKLLK